MTAILTTVRNAIWTCLDNYADLNPGAVSVFTTKFKTDALLERLELQGVFLSDLPAVAVRWAAIDPSWQTYNSQIWPVVVVLETWSALGSLSTIEARSQTVIEAVDVLDFGRGGSEPGGAPTVAFYPGPDQRDVPLYGAGETPSPLPAGASYPIGDPITIQPIAGTALAVSAAELRNPSGALVPLYPSPPDCAASCYALLPIAGLHAGTTYTAHVAGTVDGVAFDRTWSFTTTACDNPLLCSGVKP